MDTSVKTALQLWGGTALLVMIIGWSLWFWTNSPKVNVDKANQLATECYDCQKYIKAIKKCHAKPLNLQPKTANVFVILIGSEFGGDDKNYAFADILPCLIKY